MNIIKLMIPKIKVAYCNEGDTMRQALEKMRSHGYTMVPVIASNGKCVGTISEGDFLWNIIDSGRSDMKSLENCGIKDIINETRNPAVRIDVDESVLYRRIAECNFVPVTDDRGCFVGIVTRRAVLNNFREEFSGVLVLNEKIV